MSQIIVLGQFDIHPDDTATAIDLMRIMMTETAKEPGCIHYAFSRDLTSQNRIQLSELWESAEALEAHFHTPHMARHKEGMANIRVESRWINRYKGEPTGRL